MDSSTPEVTQRYPQIYVSPTSKYQFSERHGETIPRTRSIKVSMLSNFKSRM